MPEARKILEISGTYYISLPRNWVKFHKLKKGDTVFISITDEGSLEITPKEKREEEKVRIIQIPLDDYVDRRIIAAYLGGYDIIEAVTLGKVTDAQRKKVEETIKKLIGLVIVEETPNKIILQSFSKSIGEVWSLIKRMNDIAKSMYVDAIIALMNSDSEVAESVIRRDDNVDRLYFFLVRIIRANLMSLRRMLKEYKISPLELLDYRLLSRAIENIADYGESMARNVLSILNQGYIISKDLCEQLYKIVRNLKNAQDKVLSAYKSRNLVEAVEVVKDLHKINKKLMDMRKVIEDYNIKELVEIVDCIENILRIIEDMGDLVF